MGLFSKTCAKTHLPVLYGQAWSRDAQRLTRVVLLQRGEEPVLDIEYDGYGLGLGSGFEDAKLVLQSDYDGESFEELGESHSEPSQGYFHSTEFILALAQCPGFESFDAYESALFAYEQRCEEASAQLLLALGYTFEEGKSYKLASLLEAVAEGDRTAIERELDRNRQWQDVPRSVLEEDAKAYKEQYRAKSVDIARDVVAEFALKGAPGEQLAPMLDKLQSRQKELATGDAVQVATASALGHLLADWRVRQAAGSLALRDVRGELAKVRQALVDSLA